MVKLHHRFIDGLERCKSRSVLVRIEQNGTLNSDRCTSVVLRPLTHLYEICKTLFLNDEPRPNVAGIVWTFFNTEKARLLPLHVHQIWNGIQLKTFCQWLQSDCLVTTHELILPINSSILLKLQVSAYSIQCV